MLPKLSNIKTQKKYDQKINQNVGYCGNMNTFVHFDNDNDVESAVSYYKLNYMCFYNLFNSPDYIGRINVVNNLNIALNQNNDDDNKFILVVGTEKPNIGDGQANNNRYEIRVICCLKSNK